MTPTDADPRDLLVALHADPEVGPAAACRLAAHPERWPGAAPGEMPALARELGVPRDDVERARELAPRAHRLAAAERRRTADAGGRLLTRLDPGYPRPFLDLGLPPPVLAVAGELPAAVVEGGAAVAMVGSRRADAYGLDVATRFSRALAGAGLPVVSGFARGVDTACHRGALDGGGTTVAVLGCGLDVPYPRGRAHRRLFARIAEGGGAVVSEFPCGAAPRRWHFPVRNRLIAALALGTLVVRAAKRSGSLITARHALDLGREVLAVPGPVFQALSAGPHHLLADGAAVAASPAAVLDALLGPSGALGLLQVMAERRAERSGVEGTEDDADGAEGEAAGAAGDGRGSTRGGDTGGGDAGPAPPRRGAAARVLAALPPGESRSPETVAGELGEPIDAVLGTLLELEIQGWVRRMPGPAYARRSA